MLADEVVSAVEGIRAALGTLRAVDLDALAVPDILKLADLCETMAREHTVIRNDIALKLFHSDLADLGGAPNKVLADMIRITPAEAQRRMVTTEPLAARPTLLGPQLAPRQPATAAAWRRGELDEQHVRVIQQFLSKLPGSVPDDEKESAEVLLAEKAAVLRPDQLAKLANRLALTLNPDGDFSDEDRARRRGFTWGPQEPNGMSAGRLYASPELRAYFDALFAKFAAPGMCNPADQTPVVTGAPTDTAINADARTTGQRQHDALMFLARRHLGDPKLGQHNGLPVTVIATATVQDLENATGHATTGGGTRLPMSDLIRMAAHAHHYLALFDRPTGQALRLFRTKRVATADQRLVLHATDRGCTYPGCSLPGYLTEVHHVQEWQQGGLTNIDNLTFACGPHHRLIKPGGWATRKTPHGDTEWIPPPQLSFATGGTNTYHHPENLLKKPTPHKRQ